MKLAGLSASTIAVLSVLVATGCADGDAGSDDEAATEDALGASKSIALVEHAPAVAKVGQQLDLYAGVFGPNMAKIVSADDELGKSRILLDKGPHGSVLAHYRWKLAEGSEGTHFIKVQGRKGAYTVAVVVVGERARLIGETCGGFANARCAAGSSCRIIGGDFGRCEGPKAGNLGSNCLSPCAVNLTCRKPSGFGVSLADGVCAP